MKKYYGVAYLRNGDACICSGCDTEEEVREALKKAIVKHPGEIVATTYMAREQGSLEEIFGHPRSRDLMQDKKFLKEITANHWN